MTDSENPADAPLDPATERVRRKMVRLLAVSIGIMFIGVMTVLAAVVYRTTQASESLPEEGGSVAISLPVPGEIVETGLDGDRILIRLASPDGGQELFVIDRRTGGVLSRHPLTQP